MKDCPKCRYSNHEGESMCYNCGHVFFVENFNHVNSPNVNHNFNNGNNQNGLNNNYGYANNNIPNYGNNSNNNQNNFVAQSFPAYIKTNGYAKAAFTLGLLSIPLKCGVDIVLAALSLLFGVISIIGILLSFGKEKGIVYALIGMFSSTVTAVVYIYFIIPYLMEKIN